MLHVMLSWKQCAHPVITTMALWHMMWGYMYIPDVYIYRHFAFINYIALYNKTYAKIHCKFYNNSKCHHRNKVNNLPIKKSLTCLLNCNKRIEKNIRVNDRRDRTKKLLK